MVDAAAFGWMRLFRNPLSARTHIAILVIVCVLPMLVFSAFAMVRSAVMERDADRHQYLSTARALSEAVDLRLKTAIAALSALATSPALRDGNLERFYQQCAETGTAHKAWVILADLDGQPRFNTLRPYGTELNRLVSARYVRAAAASRTAQISDVFFGPLSQRLQISVYVPVLMWGEVTHVLMMSFPIQGLNRLLLEQNLPKSWTVVVLDRNNIIVARNRAIDRFGGKTAHQSLLDGMADATESTFDAMTNEGTRVFSAVVRSPFTGWKLAIGVPRAEMDRPLIGSLISLAVAANAMLLVGLVMAALVGRRMAVAMRQLSAAALALGHGKPMAAIRTPIREVNDVVQSLEQAEALLRQRSRQRDEAEAALRESERQLQHSQRLEALGTLAGGIAHDLNNTLVPILAIAQLGVDGTPDGSEMREDFTLIKQAGMRARDLVKRILAFSRKGAAEPQAFQVEEVVCEALAMLRPGISPMISIESDVRPVPTFVGDPSQIHQIVINLVTNAVQAIGDRAGTITVTLARRKSTKTDEPDSIRLAVADSGCGIDRTTRERIFEPFYTTKPVGEGSGLGLSMVHGIVVAHGGTIAVESEPGRGAKFIVDLPLTACRRMAAPADERVVA